MKPKGQNLRHLNSTRAIPLNKGFRSSARRRIGVASIVALYTCKFVEIFYLDLYIPILQGLLLHTSKRKIQAWRQ